MSKLLLRKPRGFHRRWFYGLLSVFTALTFWLTSLPAVQAFSIEELIFHGVRIIQLSTISDRQEVTLGKQINKQMVGREFKLYPSPALTQYIDLIGQRLVKASERPDIPYTFQVVNDNKVNAFATMGGFVYIHKGLILAADNEAELASVIAHEISHIVGRHSLKQMRQIAIAQGVSSAAGLDNNAAVQIGVELALRRPNSREAEYEADRLGIVTLGRAGYVQDAAVDFMGKLLGSGSPPTILSTHPATSDRIKMLKQYIDPRLNERGVGMNSAAYREVVQRLM
ncbi:MAG: M48 family metallopeptidase [Cyanobacteria bacterium J06592_8]